MDYTSIFIPTATCTAFCMQEKFNKSKIVKLSLSKSKPVIVRINELIKMSTIAFIYFEPRLSERILSMKDQNAQPEYDPHISQGSFKSSLSDLENWNAGCQIGTSDKPK